MITDVGAERSTLCKLGRKRPVRKRGKQDSRPQHKVNVAASLTEPHVVRCVESWLPSSDRMDEGQVRRENSLVRVLEPSE